MIRCISLSYFTAVCKTSGTHIRLSALVVSTHAYASSIHFFIGNPISFSSQSYPLMEPMSQANGFWSASAGGAGGRGRSSSVRSTHVAPDRPSRPRLLCRHTPPPCLWDRPCRSMRQQRHNRGRSNQRRPFGRRRVGWAIITSYAREKLCLGVMPRSSSSPMPFSPYRWRCIIPSWYRI